MPVDRSPERNSSSTCPLLVGAAGALEVEPEELWKRRFARTVLRLALRICTTFSRRVACACRTIELLLLSAVTVLVKAVNCDMITELEIVRKESEVEEQTCVLVKLST